MSIEILTFVMFGGLILLLIMGVPLSFCLSGVSLAITAYVWGPENLLLIIYNIFGGVWNEVYIAIPLFVLMGVLLERAGIADQLFDAAYQWFGRLRGGLAMGTVIICAIFAAMTGLTGAATVTMGLIAVPAMLKRQYDRSLALGTVAAAGTMGILIPPSISMVLIAAIAQLSVGKLFMGGVIPGIMFTVIFIAYIGIRGWLDPKLCPASEDRYTILQKIVSMKTILMPAVLVMAVTGSIMFGVATPTEASALGATGTLIVIAVNKKMSWQLLKNSTLQAFRITGMVMWIVLGAICFSAVYTGLGGIEFVNNLLMETGLSKWVIFLGLVAVIFILGLFLDPTGIIFIVAPVGFPVIKALGFDPIWFGVIIIIGLQVGYITPPFGFNLFYLKATAPPEITMGNIYSSIWPFVLLLCVGLALCIVFPQLILWLPNAIMK